MTKDPFTVLQKVRELLGPQGENWLQGDLHDGKGKMCLGCAIGLAEFEPKGSKKIWPSISTTSTDYSLTAVLVSRKAKEILGYQYSTDNCIGVYNDLVENFHAIQTLLYAVEQSLESQP